MLIRLQIYTQTEAVEAGKALPRKRPA